MNMFVQAMSPILVSSCFKRPLPSSSCNLVSVPHTEPSTKMVGRFLDPLTVRNAERHDSCSSLERLPISKILILDLHLNLSQMESE